VSAFLELLGPAMVAIVLLVGIHTLFGMHVLRRNVVFIDLALAQMAALGATVAFGLGYLPLSAPSYAYSFAFTLAGALLLSGLRFLPRRIPHEALIGILYIVAAAATMLFIEKSPQGAEHLKQLLTGNIVTVNYDEVFRLVPLYLGIGLLVGLVTLRNAFATGGLSGWLADLLFYAAFGAVVTSSVAIAGVLLVFSFLIIPACIGQLFTDKTAGQWMLGVAFGSVAGAVGLVISYTRDLSAGAAVVCAFGVMLALIGLARLCLIASRQRVTMQYLRRVAAALAGVLITSALWILASPRSDQPALDMIEAMLPGVRELYLTDAENHTVVESMAYAHRYQLEAQRLNRMEEDDRASGALSDDKVMKIASYIKSYNEMSKGENFVSRETVARARVRNRFWLFAAHASVGFIFLWVASGRIGGTRKPVEKPRAHGMPALST
jgi:zinc/manganese transport system permease protein